jgi:hypothetical protein
MPGLFYLRITRYSYREDIEYNENIWSVRLTSIFTCHVSIDLGTSCPNRTIAAKGPLNSSSNEEEKKRLSAD